MSGSILGNAGIDGLVFLINFMQLFISLQLLFLIIRGNISLGDVIDRILFEYLRVY